ncbi:MAG TPA: hypothetical protein VKZ75_09625 [Cyclobacteriaceae bacterium]|jgi:hypothetical protein|nr:hypothetical protein [Cyclobacteriaceae bacterium]
MTHQPQNRFLPFLSGGDLRSIAHVDDAIKLVRTQQEFDELFALLGHPERLVVMRTADAVEKITKKHPEYLKDHKKEIIQYLSIAKDKELKWHLAELVSRIALTASELIKAEAILSWWAKDPKESRIVRVFALQALFTFLGKSRKYQEELIQLMNDIEQENIPSLNARIRKLKKQMDKSKRP